MADHRNSWELMLPADPVQAPAQDGGPLARLAIIERASTSDHQVPPEHTAWFHRAMAAALEGTPAAEAFGFVAARGRSDRTPRAQLIRQQRRQAVTLLIPEGAANANQAAAAVHAITSGRAAPPSAAAAEALAELRRLRGDLPKSKSGVLVIVAEIFKK